MTAITGDTLHGVSAPTLWTLHNRATETKGFGGTIPDAAVAPAEHEE